MQVLSCSTDSRFVHKIWQEEELSKMVDGGMPFPMLSDAGGSDTAMQTVDVTVSLFDCDGALLQGPVGTSHCWWLGQDGASCTATPFTSPLRRRCPRRRNDSGLR